MRGFSTVLVSMAVSFSGLAEPRGLAPEDFYQEVIVEDTALSPDGSLLAFTLMRIDEDENERVRGIWMQKLEKGKPVGAPYPFSNSAANASDPRWSPDGSVLSFQSKRGDDPNTIWFVRMDAAAGEAYHIEGVDAAPIWSPNGTRIAFVRAPEDGDREPAESAPDNESAVREENGGSGKKEDPREGWISPEAITETVNPKRFDGRVYTTMRMKRDGTLTLLPDPSARDKKQIFVAPSEGGAPVQVTDLDVNVSDVVWAGDSEHLLFSADEKEDDEYNYDYTRDIYSVHVEGGAPEQLTAGMGNERGLAVSSDGRRLAYLFTPDRGEQTDVYAVRIAQDGSFEGEPVNLSSRWDYAPGAPDWAGSDRSVRWTSGISGAWHVFESDLDGTIEQITDGERYLRGVSHAADARYMAYAATDPREPGILYVARKDGSRETGIVNPNEDWLADIVRMPAERLTWTVEDGTEIEGWVIKPVGYSPGVRDYPMILKIHGGPHSAYGNYWFRTFHVLSNAGFFVLYTNPRGSSGYGHDFTYATRGQWGRMDSEDYLRGVDAAIAKYSDIDPARVGVSGGSYGGFMTAWLTGTTNRFAAANPSRMVSNWQSWYGASDAQPLTEYEFDGMPWEVREQYRELSPIRYVENVVAPTLIIHSENDYRTPIADAEQWYMALKKRGVPVELVRYPRSSHGLSRTGEPWLLVDRLERIASWFTHWLIDEGLTYLEAQERYAGDLSGEANRE